MSTATITYACQCSRGHICAACRAWRQDQHPKPWMPEVAPKGHPAVDISALIAGHEDVACRIAAGETYPHIAQAYEVSIDTLMGYIIKTGLYVPRQAPQRAYVASLAPQIRADYADGYTIKALVRKYALTIHIVRRILHEKTETA